MYHFPFGLQTVRLIIIIHCVISKAVNEMKVLRLFAGMGNTTCIVTMYSNMKHT